MKLTLSVKLADGETYQVITNLFVIISWERKFKRPHITFETDDLATCVQIINEQRRKT
jgi:hypothetical protein